VAGITLTNAQEQLQLWLNASAAVATGQEYAIGDRKLKRANLSEINTSIDYWNRQVQRLSRGGIKIIGGTPV
jgi:hypothetical protein